MRRNHLFLFMVLTMFTMFNFQNCGEGFDAVGKSTKTLASSEKLECSDILVGGFEKSFYSFSQDNRCSHCHTSGGSGKGSFSDNDLATAFNAFMEINDVEKFSLKALSAHQSGYTGAQHQAALKVHNETWQKTLKDNNDCLNSGEEVVEEERFITKPVAIDLFNEDGTPKVMDEFREITWDLSKQDFSQGAEGAEFTISIMVTEEFKGIPVYVATFPTLKTADQTLKVVGVNVVINGEKFGRTTFDFKNITLPPFSSATLSNTGLDLQPEKEGAFMTSKDEIQIEFDYFLVD